MDWNVVIERNRERLRDILAKLVAMTGLGGAVDAASLSPLCGGGRGGGAAGADVAPEDGDMIIPRRIHRKVLALLRPAESAVRRLVIIAARDLILPPLRPRKPRPKPYSIFVRPGEMRTGIIVPYGMKPSDILPNLAKPQRVRSVSLPVTDTLRGLPRRPSTAAAPRIRTPGFSEPRRPPVRRSSLPDYLADATRLALRLQTLGRVLDDLPTYAKRFARWRARVTTQGKQHPRRTYPLRPGRPPGGRRKPTHEVHAVLIDLQYISPFGRWSRPGKAVRRNRRRTTTSATRHDNGVVSRSCRSPRSR